MEENKNIELGAELDEELVEEEVHYKEMSPTRMVVRRFFRSRLSLVGVIMLAALFTFAFLGPPVMHMFGYQWSEIDTDYTPTIKRATITLNETTTDREGNVHPVVQFVENEVGVNSYAPMSGNHILGTDEKGMDVFIRLMYGGRISLTLGFVVVILETIIGIIMGGIAGYFGGAIDNIIMRICDILMCLPGFPILLIVGTLLDAIGVNLQYKIYFLMGFLTIISWSGTARLVRGQILSLREQEYMVAAEAMGYSTKRKIFKHLVPNVMPQLIVSMTLSLGSMILYESSLSYLGLGAPDEYAAWGTMINAASKPEILQNYFNVWGPPGICIVIAVLGFNFIGDGLRDALDPKMRK